MKKINRRKALVALGVGTAGLVMTTDLVGALTAPDGSKLIPLPSDPAQVEAIFFHYGRVRLPNPITAAAARGQNREELVQKLNRECAQMVHDWLKMYDAQIAANGVKEVDGSHLNRPDAKFDHDLWQIREGGDVFPMFEAKK
jgi:hypothetical protein